MTVSRAAWHQVVMHTVKLLENEDDALISWDEHLERPGIVMVFVTGRNEMTVGSYHAGDPACTAALLTLTNGTVIHMKAAGHETTILPRFDVAWFDGVEPPEWLGDMAKPGAVVLLSRQPTSEKDTA